MVIQRVIIYIFEFLEHTKCRFTLHLAQFQTNPKGYRLHSWYTVTSWEGQLNKPYLMLTYILWLTALGKKTFTNFVSVSKCNSKMSSCNICHALTFWGRPRETSEPYLALMEGTYTASGDK